MIATLLTIAVVIALLYASQMWWKSHLNPVTIGILAWTPGLIMLHWQPYFLSPIYIHLNRPVAPELYFALAMGFFSFWAGCATLKALSRPAAFQIDHGRLALNINTTRALIFFITGFLVFVYIYLNSGLLELQTLDEIGVAESRLRLHVGPISFIILFMDVAAIGLFVRFLQSRGGLIYVLPMITAMLCQAATLQKSRFMFLVFAAILLAALHPRETYHIFFRTVGRRMFIAGLGISVLLALFAMNAARGVAATQMTAASSSVLEQVYIYSGAAAMQNVSVTLEGYLPSDEPAMGAYLARPVLWHLVDRDLFFVSRYFEGINAATYLIYGWADFRWLGFIITPFVLGIFVMLFLRLTLGGSFIGFVLGVIEMQVLVYSPNTDVMFDPTTLVLIGIGLIAQIFTYPFEQKAQRRGPPGRPPPLAQSPLRDGGTVTARPNGTGPSRR
jgi:hypothetical protein